MRKLIKERMENKVANFVGLNKVVLGIKWMNVRKLEGGCRNADVVLG